MANLFTGKILANDYTELFELADLEPTTDTKYKIQVLGDLCWLREGSTGKGFLIEGGNIVQFQQGEDDLFIKTNPDGIVVNIAD